MNDVDKEGVCDGKGAEIEEVDILSVAFFGSSLLTLT